MNSNSSLPWLTINDFLAEVGAAENEAEFVERVMQLIGNLVPYDLHCVFAVIDPEGKLCAPKTVVRNDKWFNYFINHYWRIIPDISKEKGVNTKTVDWNRYRDTEYATDFMDPQYIRYSLGVPTIGNGYIGTLALNRSKSSPQFNEKEQQIMEVLQPHLSNFFRLFTQLDQKEPLSPNVFETADKYPCLEKLTKRENEIAGLLCRGLSTQEICALLVISENTAYRHLNNIFAKLNVTSRTELVAKLLGSNLK